MDTIFEGLPYAEFHNLDPSSCADKCHAEPHRCKSWSYDDYTMICFTYGEYQMLDHKSGFISGYIDCLGKLLFG